MSSNFARQGGVWISKLIAGCTVCFCPSAIPVAEVVYPPPSAPPQVQVVRPPDLPRYDDDTNLPRSDSGYSLTDIVVNENELLKAQNRRLLAIIDHLNEVVDALNGELILERNRRENR